jgi:hypothetical protein
LAVFGSIRSTQAKSNGQLEMAYLVQVESRLKWEQYQKNRLRATSEKLPCFLRASTATAGQLQCSLRKISRQPQHI